MGMGAAEFALWEAHFRRHGFPADRLEWAAAIGASYVGATWGGKAKPADLIPRFEAEDPAAKKARVMAFFDSLVTPIPEVAGGGE